MENIIKQFAAISAQWVPNNPIKTFLPFLYCYVNKRVNNAIKVESISNGMEKLYGIHFPFQLIQCLLADLKSRGEASVEDSYWVFNLNNEHKNLRVDDSNSAKISQLVLDFKNFYKNEKYIQSHAEEILNNFFAKYDYEIMCRKIDDSNENNFVNYEYFVAEYINSLEESNSELFSFVAEIAMGSILKASIFYENIELNVFNEQIYYFDTKIILILLGYYGEYLKTEYTLLLKNLQNLGAKVIVTDYVFNEIKSILTVCESYVEVKDIDYRRSSELLKIFRAKGIDKATVTSYITNLESDIKNLGIDIEIANINFAMVNENYDLLKKSINNIYSIYSVNEYGDEISFSLENDIHSIFYAYFRRGSERVMSIKLAKVFFVTSNRKLARGVSDYNEKVHSKGICPVISDDVLGTLLFATEKKNNSFYKMSLLSYCKDYFKPTDEQIDKYISIVEKLKDNNNITSDQFYLLKNDGLVNDVLVSNYVENGFVLDEDCVYNVLDDIKSRLLGDTEKYYEDKLSQTIKDKDDERAKSDEEHRLEIDKKDEKINSLQNRILLMNIRPYKRILYSILYVVYFAIIAGSITLGFFSIKGIIESVKNSFMWFLIIVASAFLISTFIDLLKTIISKNGILRQFVNFLLKRIEIRIRKKIEKNLFDL